jgi:hypothetical protein
MHGHNPHSTYIHSVSVLLPLFPFERSPLMPSSRVLPLLRRHTLLGLCKKKLNIFITEMFSYSHIQEKARHDTF